MDNLHQMLDDHKVDLIHKNTLFSLKSISEYLGIWGDYSDEEKIKFENITLQDSKINKHFQFNGEYDRNLTYGEITKDGIEKIIQKITQYKKISDKDIFIDIGSGCGKLALHLAVKTNIKTIIGVEIIGIRNKYAKHIQNQINIESTFFINKNIIDFDLSISTIIFINGVYFGEELINKIWDKIPKGCHVIINQTMNCKLLKENFILDVSWNKKGHKFYYYIK